MSVSVPLIDNRKFEDIIEEAKKFADIYFSQWEKENDENGMAMVKLFGHLMEIVINRLNRSSEKNMLTFLDLIGAQLLPPRASQTLLQFNLAEGATNNGNVPKGIPVSAPANENHEELIFETNDVLVVTPVKVDTCFTIDPFRDQYDIHSDVITGSESGKFEVFKSYTPFNHTMYLGDSSILGFQEDGLITIEFEFDAGNIAKLDAETPDLYHYISDLEYSIGNGEWISLFNGNNFKSIDVNETTKKATIEFQKPVDINEDTINEIDNFWLRLNIKDDYIFLESPHLKEVNSDDFSVLPTIKNIQGKIQIEQLEDSQPLKILPDKCYNNYSLIEPMDNFYPFSASPTEQEILYIGSSEIFSKKNSEVKIYINLDPNFIGKERSDKTEDLELAWEYWNGKNWAKIENSPENIAHPENLDLTYKMEAIAGELTFRCPDIKEKEINGSKNHWIRIRIIAGDYGLPAYFKPIYDSETDAIDHYEWETPNPPKIREINMSYLFVSDFKQIETVITENNNKYEAHQLSNNTIFSPYKRNTEDDNTIFFGFDSLFSVNSVNMFLKISQESALDTENLNNLDAIVGSIGRNIKWEYSTTDGWGTLDVIDGTNNLTQRGIVQFIGPDDFASKEILETNKYWIRLRLTDGIELPSPKLEGLYLNTIYAENVETITDEIMGSSNGKPNQSFNLLKQPVLKGQKVWVREVDVPSDDEIEVITKNEGEDAVEIIKDTEGTITEIWILWHQVDNFLNSGNKSRHYILNSVKGIVSFGDGVYGLIPPEEINNIKCSEYKIGGGSEGNIPANEIVEFKKSVPYIDSVNNIEPSEGGVDFETIDEIKDRGPQILRNRDRAVTCEDYEWLIKQEFRNIAKVRCQNAINNNNGAIDITILPDVEGVKPYPSQAVISQITDYLSEKSLLTINTENQSLLYIHGPGYLQVLVSADIVPEKIEEAGVVKDRVISNLNLFIHPLTGGDNNNGWELGDDVHLSEINRIIQSTEGVDYVNNVRLQSSMEMNELTFNSTLSVTGKFHENSVVSYKNGKVKYLLCEEITNDVDSIVIKGFKEDDTIILEYNKSEDELIQSKKLRITSLSFNEIKDDESNEYKTILYFEPFHLDSDFPADDTVIKTTDESIFSVIKNPITKNSTVTSIEIENIKLSESDHITIEDTQSDNSINDAVVSAVSRNDFKQIYIEPNYLIYSGVHSITPQIDSL